MKRKTYRKIISTTLIALLGTATQAHTADGPSAGKAEEQVEETLRSLSTREKIAQLFCFAYGDFQTGKDLEIRKKAVRMGIGGIIIDDGDIKATSRQLNEFMDDAKTPLFIALDGEWGAGMRYYSVPSFPRQMQLGALSDESLIYRMGELIGKECRDLGFNVNFAPVVDINNNPGNPVINTRSFGEDRDKVTRFSIAYMLGMQSAGVAGSSKHFPGHGDTNVDSHKGLPVIEFDRTRLDSLELYPFRKHIEAGVDMIMVGHLSVPALDPTGTPSSISRPMLTDLLRDEMGFKGVICTDALTMKGLVNGSDLTQDEIPLASFMAGADILLMPNDMMASMKIIRKALRKGVISMEQLDEKVRRILLLKAKLGLFDEDRRISLDGIRERSIRNENLELMDEIAEKTMTLVSGSPSKPVAGQRSVYLAYMDTSAQEGSFEGVGGYPGLNPEKTADMFLETLREYDGSVEFMKYDGTPEQLESIRSYDRIIVGYHNYNIRKQNVYDIPEDVMDFMYSLPEDRLTSVYFGNPYILDRIEWGRLGTFIIAYQNTTFNAKAAAKVVQNVIPAQGVLPVSAGGLPCGYYFTE